MSKEIKSKIVDTLAKLYSSIDAIDSLIIEVNRTTDTSHGDLYTNVAMKLAKLLRKNPCLLYTSPSPRDSFRSRMPSSA